jgi:coenzyme F420-reducing hydrogenase gamma subunit
MEAARDGMHPGSPTSPGRVRPRVGVFKLASCDGCQLQVLSLEDELLELAEVFDIAHFPEASSRSEPHGAFDVALVEGSVSTPAQLEELRGLRARTRRLVTIGACATSGGIQALRNFADHDAYRSLVYPTPAYVASLATSTPVAAHVPVDFELRGCPIDKRQLLEVLLALVIGRRPQVRDEAVCSECKRRGVVCVLVASDEPCLGPVTHAGCGALCPAFARGCYGCFGPKERAATGPLADRFTADGMVRAEALRRFRAFTGWAEAFRAESERHER